MAVKQRSHARGAVPQTPAVEYGVVDKWRVLTLGDKMPRGCIGIFRGDAEEAEESRARVVAIASSKKSTS